MNKYDYYDSLKKYKKNYLQHAKSKLYGIQQDDHQYYKRIGEPGNYRYFYSKDQWDAYQKERAGMTGYEDWKKNQDAKETAKEKADMIGYDSWKKEEDIKKKAEKEAKDQKNIKINRSTGKSPTNFTDAQAQANKIGEKKEKKKQENIDKNRQADTQKKIDEILENNQNGLKRKEVYKIDDIISNSNEGKEAIELYIKMMNEYNGVYPTDKADEVKETIKQNILSAYNFDKSDIGSAIADHVTFELTQKAISKWLTLNSDKVRDAQIEAAHKKAVKEYYKDLYHVANIAVNYENNTDIDECYDILKEWRSHEDIDPGTGLPLKNYSLTVKQDLRLVNPGYFYEENSRDGNNMTEDEVTGYHHNCLLSTIACVLRERGYDVSAGTDLDGVRTWGPGFFNEYDNIYPNVETSIGDLSSIKDLRQEMERLPAGSYGDMQVVWNFFKGTGVGGHSVFFKVDNDGKLHIYDGQSGTEERWEIYEEYALAGRYYVLNDAEIDIDYIKENKMIIY